MTRLLVGPFNRVEGDLEVALDIDGGAVQSAQVTTTLYRGFEQILPGRPPHDALVIAPRICGICSVSQSLAAAAALRHIMGLQAAPNGVLAARIAHAAENMADHLTHFYLFFMPDFARDCYAGQGWFPAVRQRFKAVSGQAAAPMLAARRDVLQVMGLLAGKWPHSLAFQPGGTTQAVDMGGRVRLAGIWRHFRDFLETHLFAAPLETVLALSSYQDLLAWAQGNGGDFAQFVRVAEALHLDRLGLFTGPLVSYGAYDGLFPQGVMGAQLEALDVDAIAEDVAHAWLRGAVARPHAGETWPDAHKEQGYSWAKAPRLGGQAAEMGAVARQRVAGDALVADLIGRAGGTNVLVRVVARLRELAKVVAAAEDWVRQLQLKQDFCVPAGDIPDGMGVGLVEAARGGLGHWLAVKDQKIQRYQIIAPTTWNFSPRDGQGQAGPLEQALVGVDVGALGSKSPQVQHIVRSFDPCMVCTAH